MTFYHGQRVVIVGLGITGLSCVNFFLARGIRPRVMDTRINPPELSKLSKDIQCRLGELDEQWLFDSTLIVVSPGVLLSHPALVTAAKLGIEIIGDIELFMREVTEPVVAITGSNGKSTVAKLVSKMAVCAGLSVGLGGNIGFPVLMMLGKGHNIYVLEISSFQLEIMHNLHVSVATILNISSDHMDRYPFGLQQYHLVKLKIYQNATTFVVNAEDPMTLPIYNNDNRRCISFGITSGDYYLRYQRGKMWLMMHDDILINCDEIKISGYHNYANVLAALALADAVMISRSACLMALRQFRGLDHRFELVHYNNGISWINDSKATNVGSTVAALCSVDVPGTLHLLVGGEGKRADFSPLSYWMQKNKVNIYCFGKDSKCFTELQVGDVIVTSTMEQAIRIIARRVFAKDVVLLSPACSSVDQFNNFEVRGNFFTFLARDIG